MFATFASINRERCAALATQLEQAFGLQSLLNPADPVAQSYSILATSSSCDQPKKDVAALACYWLRTEPSEAKFALKVLRV